MIARIIAHACGSVVLALSTAPIFLGEPTHPIPFALSLGGITGAGLIFAWLAPVRYEEDKEP